METEERRTEGTAPPEVLGGRYELGETLGFGGMAEVRRGRDRRLDRDVAIKLLSGAAAKDPSRRRRIEREARALAALNHANVVAVYDYAEEDLDDGGVLPYVVLELVDGPDLHNYVESKERLSEDEAVGILRSVLSGVGRAHEEGIVHGDLKPANILLAEHGPKVGDFGVARILGEETGATTLAATPSFAAPEVLRGAKPTPASDLYSVACLAYEILTGRAPYEGENGWEVASKHMEAPLPSVRLARGSVSVGVDEAIRRGMQKDPRRRFASAAEFASALGSSAPTRPVRTIPAAAAPTVPQERTEVLPLRPTRVERWRSRMGAARGSRTRGLVIGSVVLAVLLWGLLGLRGEATVAVPELRGMAYQAAVAELEGVGFALGGVSYAPVADGEPGLVVSTMPSGDVEAEPGSEVHLVVGLRPATPEPPPVDRDDDDEGRGRDEDRGRGNGGKAFKD